MVREVTTIRERHVQVMTRDDEFCSYCSVAWPCDAIREADRADKAEAALANIHRPCDGDADGEWPHCACHCPDTEAARADAAALAEALKGLRVSCWCHDDYVERPNDAHMSWCDDARAALAVHDALKERR